MWPHEAAHLDQIRDILTSSGLNDVCDRCQLRLAGIKDSRQYIRTTKDQRDEPASKRAKTNPCIACLGVLQEDFMEDTLTQLSQEVNSSGYDANHFTVAISLPVSLALRSHSMNVFLDEMMTKKTKEGKENKNGLFDPDDVVPIKQVWKWLFSKRVEEKLVGRKYVGGDNCEFYVELEILHDDDEKELDCLQKMCEKEYAMRQKKHKMYHMGLVTRQGAEKSLSGVTSSQFKSFYPVPPEPPSKPYTSQVKMYHNSIFIAGRYNKYSRQLPQTPWIVDGEKKLETSVEEIIVEEFHSAFQFDQAKFSSSGREDVDVRMLGRGRPFLLEVVNPRKTFIKNEEFRELERKINAKSGLFGQVKVRDVQIVSKLETKLLKEGEDQKTKVYTALCTVPKKMSLSEIQLKLETIRDLEIDQKTPIRVLHRRPNAIRKRSVYYMQVSRSSKSDPNEDLVSFFRLKLATQAGTYIKEFVHGDFERTKPNLRGILGCAADIIALDVESIELNWPPDLSEGSPDSNDCKKLPSS